MNTGQLAADLQRAFMQVGETMIKPEFAAKLLAFTYHFNTELTVLHTGMHAGIRMAQELANLKGGEVPDRDIRPMIIKHIRELKAAEIWIRRNKNKHIKEEQLYLKHAPWLQEIYDRYELENYYTAKSLRK
jgi:hypothetical protein